MSSYGMRYILVEFDYVSKYLEVVSLLENEGRSVIVFFKENIFFDLEHYMQLLVTVGHTYETACSKYFSVDIG